MSFGNTIKDGSGSVYWLLQNADGQLIVAPGWVTDVDIDTTANDSDKSVSVPASTVWIVESIWVKLITTATVGNRVLYVEILDGSANVIGQYRSGTTQAASLTRYYLFDQHIEAGAVDTDLINVPMPEIQLPATYSVRVYDSATIDAAADDMEVTIKYREIST